MCIFLTLRPIIFTHSFTQKILSEHLYTQGSYCSQWGYSSEPKRKDSCFYGTKGRQLTISKHLNKILSHRSQCLEEKRGVKLLKNKWRKKCCSFKPIGWGRRSQGIMWGIKQGEPFHVELAVPIVLSHHSFNHSLLLFLPTLFSEGNFSSQKERTPALHMNLLFTLVKPVVPRSLQVTKQPQARNWTFQCSRRKWDNCSFDPSEIGWCRWRLVKVQEGSFLD